MHILGRAAPTVMDITDNVLGLPQKPPVSPVESIPRVNFLNTLWEHGIAVVLVFVLLPGHIRQNHGITDMMVFFAELPQSRAHIGVKRTLVAHIKALNPSLGDKLLNGDIQRGLYILWCVFMPEKATCTFYRVYPLRFWVLYHS